MFLHPFDVADAALEADARILLPSALLMCCREDVQLIVSSGSSGPERAPLCEANACTILRSRPQLSLFIRDRIVPFAFDLCDMEVQGCRHPGLCSSEKNKWAVSVEGRNGWVDPFVSFESLPETLCAECTSNAIGSIVSGRKALWNSLPRLFGIGNDWTEVKEATRL